jgi:hypothetical protein
VAFGALQLAYRLVAAPAVRRLFVVLVLSLVWLAVFVLRPWFLVFSPVIRHARHRLGAVGYVLVIVLPALGIAAFAMDVPPGGSAEFAANGTEFLPLLVQATAALHIVGGVKRAYDIMAGNSPTPSLTSYYVNGLQCLSQVGTSDCISQDYAKGIGSGLDEQIEFNLYNVFSQFTSEEFALLAEELVATTLSYHPGATDSGRPCRELIYNVDELYTHCLSYDCPMIEKLLAALDAQRDEIPSCTQRGFRQILRIYCRGDGLALAHHDKGVTFRKIDVRLFDRTDVHILRYFGYTSAGKNDRPAFDARLTGTMSLIMRTVLSGSVDLPGKGGARLWHQFLDTRTGNANGLMPVGISLVTDYTEFDGKAIGLHHYEKCAVDGGKGDVRVPTELAELARKTKDNVPEDRRAWSRWTVAQCKAGAFYSVLGQLRTGFLSAVIGDTLRTAEYTITGQYQQIDNIHHHKTHNKHPSSSAFLTPLSFTGLANITPDNHTTAHIVLAGTVCDEDDNQTDVLYFNGTIFQCWGHVMGTVHSAVFWQSIYARIGANDTEAIAWYKNRNQAISDSLTSFWQGIYTRIGANDTEAIAWYTNRNQATSDGLTSFWQGIYARIGANDTEAIAWYANRNSGYGNTHGTHDQERHDRQKEALYQKYRCGRNGLNKSEWPVSCFVLCVILPDDAALFTEAVQVPGDGLLRARCASMGRRCKIG